MSYVNVARRSGESIQEARRRRRYELARGWGFACTCTRCEAEKDMIGSPHEESVPKIEVRVEPAVARFEAGHPVKS